MITLQTRKTNLGNEHELNTQMNMNLIKKNILYVNQSGTNTEVVRQIIKSELAAELYVTKTLSDALKILQNFVFDIVIIDANDIKNSMSFFSRELVNLENKKIPVLLISNQDFSNNKHFSGLTLFDDVISKPVDINKFIFKVSTLIN